MTQLTEQQLIRFVDELRHVDGLDARTPLFSDGTIDSVGLIALIGFIERTCGIEVGPADVTLDNFDTIERMLAYVATKVVR
jgi:acyl carrier protein